MCQHITVLLRNVPGEFSGVAKSLKDEGVNIMAFHVANSSSKGGYAQLVCDDHMKALVVLKGIYHTYVYESEVIAIRTENVPGSLYEILSRLLAQKINIETAYQTLGPNGGAIIVLEPVQNDMERAKAAVAGSPGLIDDFSTIWAKP